MIPKEIKKTKEKNQEKINVKEDKNNKYYDGKGSKENIIKIDDDTFEDDYK